MNDSGDSQSGFTLLEVLIAFAILSLSLSVLLQIFSTALDRSRDSETEMIAAAYTRSLLAELGTTMAITPGDFSGVFTDGFRWHLHIVPFGNAVDRQRWPVAPVRVTASTQSREGRGSVTVTTIRLIAKSPK